ncbi:MAG: FeoB-associated Cys-rich membrane protein [Oscillospiraceae bacterium]|jgi:glycerol uptake facilitator-like aquaporin|nr:FeoB-associated Cys-rich membrane protein [Oscillospiraceae bacterium]
MAAFVSEYLGTIFVLLVVLGTVVGVIVKLVKDKKKGKCPGCACGSGACPHGANCMEKGKHADP